MSGTLAMLMVGRLLGGVRLVHVVYIHTYIRIIYIYILSVLCYYYYYYYYMHYFYMHMLCIWPGKDGWTMDGCRNVGMGVCHVM